MRKLIGKERKMKAIARQVLTLFLCAGLVFIPAMGVSGCNASQFEAVLNEIGPAISTILQIVALVQGGAANTALPAKVSADVAALEKLYADFEAANSTSKGSIEAEIQAGFTTLNADLSSVFSVAQVSDKNTQAKITALIGLVESAVQIAEAAIPTPTPATLAAVRVAPVKLDAESFVSSFNKILTAKTGNQEVDEKTPHLRIHHHGMFLRVVSFGAAQ